MKTNKSWLTRFLVWRIRHINQNNFIYILSVVIGIISGIAAIILYNTTHLIKHLLTRGFTKEYHNYLYFIYPSVGILMVVLFVKYVIKKPIRDGIPNVLYSISRNNGIIGRHNMFSSLISSALTVGFGGSVGLEGPTVATGAAIGSNIAQLFRLTNKQVILLVGCASAGSLAAIFKAPIAAVIFVLEVIMLDLTMSSLIPLLISTVTAVLTSYYFLGQSALYNFPIAEGFKFFNLPFYIGLGIFAGLVSVYFTRTYMIIEKFFSYFKGRYTKLVIGGTMLGLLIFILPSLYGEGYEVINNCLHEKYIYLFNHSLYYQFNDKFWAIIILFAAIVFFKAIATSVTLSCGGVGGIFAPTLFLGACSGLLFALLINNFTPWHISESKFAFAGMAGLIAGVIHAPLTAIFMIAEITGGYQLFVPLMITSTIAYATTRIFVSNSVYTIQLAQSGDLLTHDKDKAVLSQMNIETLIDKDFETIFQEATLGDLIQIVSKSNRNIFPVIDKDNNLIGIIRLNDIRKIMFNPDEYETTYVKDIMYMPEMWISFQEPMEQIAEKFQGTKYLHLPVLDHGKYVGFITRAKVFSIYRSKLKSLYDEE